MFVLICNPVSTSNSFVIVFCRIYFYEHCIMHEFLCVLINYKFKIVIYFLLAPTSRALSISIFNLIKLLSLTKVKRFAKVYPACYAQNASTSGFSTKEVSLTCFITLKKCTTNILGIKDNS